VNRLVILLAAAALAACGNNNPTLNQDGPGPTADAPNHGSGGSDGGMTPETLTAFVIDLITNHTSATELPQPYSAFSSLPDPDGSANNLAAYQALF
jgi:hypothetical protein